MKTQMQTPEPEVEVEQQSPQEIVDAAKELREQNRQRFDALAKENALGRKVSISEILRVANAAGCNVEDFTSHADTHKFRIEQRASAAGLELAREEYETCKAELNALNNALDARVSEFQARAVPLQQRLNTLKDAYVRLMAIPAELLATCPNAKLKAQIHSVGNEAERLHRRGHLLREDIERLVEAKPASAEIKVSNDAKLARCRAEETRVAAAIIEKQALLEQLTDEAIAY